MRRRWAALGLGLLWLGLSGCSSAGPYGRELEETVLVRVLGVDRLESGVTLTAAGIDGAGETVLARTTGATLEEAFAALPTAGEEYLSLTTVTQIRLGEGTDWRAVLDYVVKDKAMSYTATVWAVNGFAGDLLEQTTDGGVGRFGVLDQSGVEEVTVKTALAGLLTDGSVMLPVLALRESLLTPVGTLSMELRGAAGETREAS